MKRQRVARHIFTTSDYTDGGLATNLSTPVTQQHVSTPSLTRVALSPLSSDVTHPPDVSLFPVPPPPDVRPPSPPRFGAPARLPNALARLGNARAWRETARRLDERPHEPLIVWGPTGCGKSRGVRCLLEAMRCRVVEFDGADGDTNDQLVEWIQRTRERKSAPDEPPKTAVVLDDFESFTEEMRRRLSKLLAKDDPHLSPIVVTCTQLRGADVKPIAHLSAVRLYAPSTRVVTDWFVAHHVWTRLDGRRVVGFPRSLVDLEPDLVARGDLRKLAIALEWRGRAPTRVAVTDAKSIASSDHAHATTFDATRDLLTRKIDAETWTARCDGAWDVALARHHLPTCLHDDELDALDSAYDALSLVDVTRPERFELRASHAAYAARAAADALARAVRAPRARAIGALVPPPRTDRYATGGAGTSGDSGSRADPRDCPALLRDRA